MTDLPHVAQGDPHVQVHNDERDAINAAPKFAYGVGDTLESRAYAYWYEPTTEIDHDHYATFLPDPDMGISGTGGALEIRGDVLHLPNVAGQPHDVPALTITQSGLYWVNWKSTLDGFDYTVPNLPQSFTGGVYGGDGQPIFTVNYQAVAVDQIKNGNPELVFAQARTFQEGDKIAVAGAYIGESYNAFGVSFALSLTLLLSSNF